MTNSNIVYLDWPAPENVVACYTRRTPGFSTLPFDSFNLAHHVGDVKERVDQNRQVVLTETKKPICWLSQTHSTTVVEANFSSVGLEADASWSRDFNYVASVMTADCLPVFFCDTKGDQVAVAHAGWRGLLDGILENTVKTFNRPKDVMVYLGPAIGPNAFEVGNDVRNAFLSESMDSVSAFIEGKQDGKWMADIYELAKLRLTRMGISQIFGGNFCTYSDKNNFFSYRRDGTTGRMANLIWKNDRA